MTFLHRLLDVLRVMIETANDNEIFQPAADVQLAVADKPKITGAQKRSLTTIAGKARLKRLLGFCGAIPVAECHTRIRNPDLTDLINATPATGLRINDYNTRIVIETAATDEDLFVRFIVRCRDPILLQSACRQTLARG